MVVEKSYVNFQLLDQPVDGALVGALHAHHRLNQGVLALNLGAHAGNHPIQHLRVPALPLQNLLQLANVLLVSLSDLAYFGLSTDVGLV